MIIIDFNQTLISSLMAQINSNPNNEISETLIRHMVLRTILHYKKAFGPDYGELLFAADDKNYWRRDLFKNYKSNRKKSREQSGFDWNLIFNTLNKIRDEIREIFPYKVIQVSKAEADDIIATLCKYTQNHGLQKRGIIEDKQKVLIVSGDKDFMQLQKYDNVKQFSPMQGKFLTSENPALFLKEHILRGDSGDGIPNFLSPDDVFVTEGTKQKSIMTKKLEVWLHQDPDVICETEEQKKNYIRNQQVIDFEYIPEYIQEDIIKQYEAPVKGKKSMLFDYFVKHGLKNLMEDLTEF